MRNPIQDYYAILGVHPSAEDIVIRAAYKALAQRYHPDRFAGSKEEAHRRMSDLTEAYEVLADPVRRPKYDRRRYTFAASVAGRFNGPPKYASPALDPGEPRSAGAKWWRSRAALSALMAAVVVLSAVNLFHYSTRLKEWLGASMPAAATPERANPGSATNAPVVGAVGTVPDDPSSSDTPARTRNLPISQGSAPAVETATPKTQPSTFRGPDPAAGRAPATAAVNPCREAVAALGLCNPNMTAKNK